MVKLNLESDEATILKFYRVSSLQPTQWEDFDHENADSVAGAILSPMGSTSELENDPLGLGAIVNIRGMSMEKRAAVLLSSKSFDPKAFLSEIHPHATYQDLSAGMHYLQRSLDSRSEAIRTLVEDNFDRFVAVKSAVDSLQEEMKEEMFAEGKDFGVAGLKEQLKQAATKADQVFLPVLENAQKAEKLRTTLAVFERSQFFFNLPGSLRESIDSHRYEAALRDYKKGKFILESKPGQLTGVSSGNQVSSQSSSSAMGEHQKRIFDKVWVEVEKVMDEMRSVLTKQLKEPSRAVDEQEKTIEIITELSPSEDPVWIFLDSQYQHILKNVKKTHERHLRRVLDSQAMPHQAPKQAMAVTVGLEGCLNALSGKQPDTVIAQGDGHSTWQAMHELTKGISEVLASSLPSFWKIASNYIGGKYRRDKTSSTGNANRDPSRCRAMATDIIKLYVSLLSQLFTITDAEGAPSITEKTPSPDFPPLGTNSLTTCHYLIKIIADITECINEVGTSEISSDTTQLLKTTLDTVRSRFVEILCDSWLNDARSFHKLETWESSKETPNTTTYLSQIHKFQKQNTTCAYKIASGTVVQSSSTRSVKQPIAPDFTTRIIKAFLDCLYAMLDGLKSLALEPPTDEVKRRYTSHVPDSDTKVPPVDLDDPDTRLLLVLANLAHLKKTSIPNMISQLETAFGISIHQERGAVLRAVNELDLNLFQELVKPKSLTLTTTIQQGILDSEMDWFETSRPTEVRPYMFKVLLNIVEYHAKVSSVAKSLLDRVISTLVAEVATEALQCFKKVKRFGMGGMLRATLEVEFMHQTLVRYVTPTAHQTLTEIYTTISDAYERKEGAQENLQVQLDGVKKTLQDTRKATAINFVCFRAHKSSDKERDRTGAKEARDTERGRARDDGVPSGDRDATREKRNERGRERNE
ncbi:hypothetical protein FRC03_004111 [Tulasnella sp. 419]|nr:hypothetical protein FRC02_008153 [Tulasnella sp. 418]KAG8970729.1 hypothetical protein FRC03_004111 [Tulasnella sp. 419]